MKIHTTDSLGNPIVQGSREWWALRIGKPTVSRLSRILTPAKLAYSKSAHAFAAELIAERILGEPIDDNELDTIWMERGREMEVEARKWYEFYRDVKVDQVGFITTDSGHFGGSPDGLVGDTGGVEIKCRSAKHHARCITGVDEIADRLQIQGYLWLTGREWWDVLAYNPDLPKRIVRQYPEPDVQEAIENQLARFLEDMERAERRLAELGDVIEDDEEITWDLNEAA